MIKALQSNSVNVLYPVHGTKNILRRVSGEVVKRGTGPNGQYVTVQEKNGSIRSLSLKKIVQLV